MCGFLPKRFIGAFSLSGAGGVEKGEAAYRWVGTNAYCRILQIADDSIPPPGYDECMAARLFSKKQWGSMVLALAGLAAVLFLLRMAVPGGAAVDVVHDRPLAAVHERAAGLPSAAPSADGLGRVDLPARYHDFGRIRVDEVVTRDFLLVNRGEGPLVIGRAYTTCGCTTAEISAAVIPPGKAAQVRLVFDAGFHPVQGVTVRRGLVLETNDPNHPQVEIWVQAYVK
jgi:hypothetical protein